jgi:ribosome-associated translation inhibitor RaiA
LLGITGGPQITSLNSEVGWSSKREVTKRLAELKEEIHRFLQDSNCQFYQHFLNKKWLALASYLTDIFAKLNRLNISLQGPNANIFHLFDKVSGFIKKHDTLEKPL